MNSTQPQQLETIQTTTTSTNITLIRHAESLLNIASHRFRQQNNLPYIWKILCEHKQFLLGVKYNRQFIDCDITSKGIEQCINARQNVKDLKPDLILVSPLFRTLRTCSLVLQQYIPNTKVVVQPLLSQAFRSSCDIPILTQSKQSLFPSYDFNPTLQQGQYWFIKNQSIQNQQKYYSLLQQHKQKSYTQRINLLLDYMIQSMLFETPENMRSRAYLIKRMIQEKYSKQYKNIVIVAHYNTINYLMADKFDKDSEPVDSMMVENCQVVKKTLQEMLKIR